MTPKKILVSTDFSPAADLAVQRAVALAQRHGAELRLMHAVPPQRWLAGFFSSKQEWSEQVRSRAAAMLKEQAARIAADAKIEVSTALLSGKASSAIANATAQYQPDLLVIGAYGEGQTRVTNKGLGYTASKLVGATKAPLLLVRQTASDAPNKVLAALDLTPASVRVARWANGLAAKGQATFMHVFETPFTDRLRGYGVKRKTLDVYATDQQASCERALRGVLVEAGVSNRANKLALRGEAIKSITAQFRKLKIDTLVIGKHGRRKRDAAAPYGSVCHYLAYFAPVDVLIVP